MEYVKPSMRTMGLNLCIGIFYCISCTMVPWIAVAATTWRSFLIIVSVPHILVLSFYYFVPESAQWLLSKGRTEDAVICFKRIAKINGRQFSDTLVDEINEYSKSHIERAREKNENILGLLKTPKLRKKMLILAFKS